MSKKKSDDPSNGQPTTKQPRGAGVEDVPEPRWNMPTAVGVNPIFTPGSEPLDYITSTSGFVPHGTRGKIRQAGLFALAQRVAYHSIADSYRKKLDGAKA